MSERELFVICSNCSNEVSPYVTECPYCGTRLRKRAPDLKKQKKLEEKSERKAEKRRERLRSQYEGGGSSTAWLEPAGGGRPVATIALLATAIVASVIAASGVNEVTRWMGEQLVFNGALSAKPWTLLTSPFLQYSFGYGLVCLLTFAVFGTGIERRYGIYWTVALWVVCGALGVAAEGLLAADAVTYGAYAVAVGSLLAWTVVVVNREDLRDFDSLGLAAFAFVLCALPVATDVASIWTLLGGIVGGLLCGFALTRFRQR
jgi:membrane associated rhomboid family serine protease